MYCIRRNLRSISSIGLSQVRRIPGKGLGVVAERRIAPGELVMKEAAFLSLPLTETGDLQVGATPQPLIIS